MAVGFFTVMGTALIGAVATVGAVAFKTKAGDAPVATENIRLVQCLGVREEFSPLLGHTRPAWVISRDGGTPETLCREGSASREAVRFERVPGTHGLPRLLV